MLKDNLIISKKVLLIGGGGTLGTYTAQELLKQGHNVDVICLEDKTSDNENIKFYKGKANLDYLSEFLKDKMYDGIVNFVHYPDIEEYPPVHSLLIVHTKHLIVLSSYRVYADEQHPITEEAPRLLDVIKDPDFIKNEKYAVSKAKCEDYLRRECADQPWTIVRPVISFSNRRLDLLMYSGDHILRATDQGEELLLPQFVRKYTAGLDWSGNSGKLIANLLFKDDAIGETFTIYSGHGLTWGDVAETYQKLVGLKVRWCGEKEYLDYHTALHQSRPLMWAYLHDRRYNRDVDCAKVLRVTGLAKQDFSTVEEGIKQELIKLGRSINV